MISFNSSMFGDENVFRMHLTAPVLETLAMNNFCFRVVGILVICRLASLIICRVLICDDSIELRNMFFNLGIGSQEGI